MTAFTEKPTSEEVEYENPSQIVWRLAWPVVAVNSLQVVNTLLDRSFIGHLPGSALTAHGGSLNLVFLMFQVGIAVATGATAIVSRAYGAQQPEEFRQASRQSVSLALAFGIVFGIVTALGARSFSEFILPTTDRSAIHQMTDFLVIYGMGLPAHYIISTLAGSLRGIGDTKSPMYISGLQILLHIVLNFLLIFPPRDLGFMTIPGAGLGLSGASLALTISAWMAAITYLAYLPRTPLGSQWGLRLPDLTWAWRIMRIAIPAGVMAILRVLSLMVFTLVLALVPDASAAIAAMTIGFAIESIMFMPSFGLSAAAGALVGQSLGMGKPERAERLAWTAGHYAALVTVLLAGPIFYFAPNIALALVGGKEDIAGHATLLLRYLCVTEIMFAYSMVMLGAMQGAGDTRRPLWITLSSLWGLRVPLAIVLSLQAGQHVGLGIHMPVGVGLGAAGAWISLSVTQAIQGALSLAAFKQGRWKETQV